MKMTFFFFVFFSAFVYGQSKLSYLIEEMPGDSLPVDNLQIHTSIRPFLTQNTPRIQQSDSLKVSAKRTTITLLPLVDGGFRYADSTQYRASMGIGLVAKSKDKIYARFSYLQGVEYSDPTYRLKTGIERIQGKGERQKIDLRGRFSYTPNRFVNLQVGYDQNFLGEGQRSLLLSDYGKPYGFGQARLNFWRLEYVILYSFMQETSPSNQYKNKFGTTHYLDVSVNKYLQFGVFETVIFQPVDTNLRRGFEPEYLNPMIFYRPQEYALGSADNVLLGIDGKIKYKGWIAYGQLALDEFSLAEYRAKSKWWANKYAIQMGIKGRISVRQRPLFVRAELNLARPYTYSHLSLDQSYTNKGEVLAHPYGANFYEMLFEAKYASKKWLFEGFVNYSLKGYDDSLNYGGNIFIPYLNRPGDFGHTIGQGQHNNSFKLMLRASYQLLKAGNTQAFGEYQFRSNTYLQEPMNQFVVGIRSRIWNDYRNY